MISLAFIVDSNRTEQFKKKINKNAYAKAIERAKKHLSKEQPLRV